MKKLSMFLFFFSSTFLFTLKGLAAEPENGWWWNPNLNGTGLNIELQNSQLFFAYFTELNGQRIAYNAACHFDGESCSGELLEGFEPTGINFTLSFPNDSSITGLATIDSATFAIERFQLGFDNQNKPLNLLGDWQTTLFGVALISDILSLNGVRRPGDGSVFLVGNRTNMEAGVVVSYEAASDTYIIEVEEGDTLLGVYRLKQNTGLNSMNGTFILEDLDGNPVSDEFTAIAIRTQQVPTPNTNMAGKTALDKNRAYRLSPAEVLGLYP